MRPPPGSYTAAYSSSTPGSVRAVVSSTGVDWPRKAEVQELDAVRGKKHVRWLEIAMTIDRRCSASRADTRTRLWPRPAAAGLGQAVGQRCPSSTSEIGLAVVLADSEELADAVAHGGGRACLAKQPVPHLWIGRRGWPDGDRALQALVQGFVDDAHAALGPDHADDAIVPDGPACQRTSCAWLGQAGHQGLGDHVGEAQAPTRSSRCPR